MRLVLSAIVLTFVPVVSQAWAADSNFERTLSTGSSPVVAVFTSSGAIRAHSGSGNQVRITAHVHSNDSWFGVNNDAESRIRQIVANPPIHQDGDHVAVGDHHPSSLFHNITIDYDITLPHDAAIEADTGSGDIELSDVGSAVRAQTGSGSVRARGVHGPATLGTGSGDVELSETTSADVHAQTGSGSIRLQAISGGLHARTGSGDIEVSGALTSDWMLDSGSGSVRLNLGPQTHFSLDADTGSGTVRVTQAILMSGDHNRHHVIGNVNGGGPALRVRTGSGDVEIH